MKRQNTEKIYGIPVWDLYSCEVCGSLIVPATADLHQEFHNLAPMPEPETKYLDKACPVCAEKITIPLDKDGSMNLDIYDEHMDTHEE